MKELLNTLSLPLLMKIILYPLIEVHKEIDAISLDRHKMRSIIKIFLITITSSIAIYYVFHNTSTNDFFLKVSKMFNMEQETQLLIANFLKIIACCNFGTYLTNIAVNGFCKYYFGDPEFYVTSKQLIKLEKKFKEQVNYEIQGKHIIEVVNFCVKNLRQQDSIEIGAKKEDWKNTLECLIYDGDAEHFLDQQKALYLKKQIIERKLRTLVDYASKNYTYNQEYQLYKATTNNLTNYGSVNAVDNMNNEHDHIKPLSLYKKIQPNVEVVKLEPAEQTPLLSIPDEKKYIKPNLHGNDYNLSENNVPLSEPPDNSNLANSTASNITKYNCLQLTPPITPLPKSKSLLIEYQKNLLKQQALTTTQQILPVPLVSPKLGAIYNNSLMYNSEPIVTMSPKSSNTIISSLQFTI